MLEAAAALFGTATLFLGLGLSTIGLYGMLRRRDTFEQLHAAALVTGPGVILVLLAAIGTINAEIITSALLVIAFVLVTSSLSTHAIALAAWRGRVAAGAAAAARTADRSAARLVDASATAPATGAGPEPGGAGATAGAAAGPMRVLVAFDGSPDADVAAQLAASLRWPEGSHVRLVAAVEGDLPPLSPRDPDEARVRGEPPELAAALDAAVARIARPAVTVDRTVRRGHPATALVEEAFEFDAELLVLGRRRLARIRSILGASVAAEVIDTAPCPVLIARSVAVREVLLPTDGSEPSAKAIELVAGWTIFERLRVHVPSVAPAAGAEMSALAVVRGRLETAMSRRHADRAAGRLRRAGRAVDVHVDAGVPVARILDLVNRESIDLVVLGTRGRTGLRRALLGSVARDVLSSAATSVLVVRGGGPPERRDPG